MNRVNRDELLGVFPIGNPIPYTGEVEVLHRGNTPSLCTWYHGTWADRVGGIARYGLLPSCWFGGDCCCVFGFERQQFDSYAKYGNWVMEIRSRAEEVTDLKAWWVPPTRILGTWHQGRFYGREELLLLPWHDITVDPARRECLDALCRAQYQIWRRTMLKSIARSYPPLAS